MKAQQLLDQLCIGICKKSEVVTLVISHNLALCHQKMGQLSECGACLKKCLMLIKKMVTPNDAENMKFKYLKYLSKVHMQYCAILSQQNKHTEALDHAKYGVKYSHEIISQSMKVAEQYSSVDYASLHNDTSSKKSHKSTSFQADSSLFPNRPFGEPIELFELIAKKVLPILVELSSRLVPLAPSHNKTQSEDFLLSLSNKKVKGAAKDTTIDIRDLFGYMQSSEWVSSLNIGNIMQISPITLQDFLAVYELDVEITRETLLEKIALLTVSYFCVSTEKRFLAQDAARRNSMTGKQSEFWHAKSLELACCFLPSECPLVNHIFTSYQKHHSPLQQAIVYLVPAFYSQKM